MYISKPWVRLLVHLHISLQSGQGSLNEMLAVQRIVSTIWINDLIIYNETLYSLVNLNNSDGEKGSLDTKM